MDPPITSTKVFELVRGERSAPDVTLEDGYKAVIWDRLHNKVPLRVAPSNLTDLFIQSLTSALDPVYRLGILMKRPTPF